MTDTNPSESKPPGNRRSRILLLAALVALIAVAIGASRIWPRLRRAYAPESATSVAAKRYQCPMHPTITSEAPGECPICGMTLVEMTQGEPPQAPAKPAQRVVAFYRSPMNPQQTSPTARKDEMGMDYVPVYVDETQPAGGSPAPGRAAITIDPTQQQLIGLKTAPVTAGPVAGSWRTVARVQVDPTRVRKTNVKVEGYVERIYVDFIGRRVRVGDPLFSLYSPSLLATENEYLIALQMKDAGGALAGSGEIAIVSARRKLELSDVPVAEIDRLERTHELSKTLTFVSPIAGVVTAKNVVQGVHVSPGDAPYEITDLGVVWVMADAYETDLPRVSLGMPASLTLQAFPNRTFKGKVDFVDPVLDPRTRTAKVHVHFPNATGELVPDMLGNVTLEGQAREGLRIPTSAVVPAGTNSVVYVSLGNGKFEPRLVQLGAQNGDLVEVVGGLALGQQVVVHGNFLVDSESLLRASLQAGPK